jgi:cytosine/adenosine deaminase-related metal-dependent hydrolase
VTSAAIASVLENARVVFGGEVVARPLAFVGGRVATSVANPFRVDLRDHLIVPGLINTHDHLQLNAIPPLAHTAPFANSYEWIDAFESHLKAPDVLSATQVSSEDRHWHGALKNLLSGVTTVAHHDPRHAVFDDPAFPVDVPSTLGWAHSLGLGTPRGGLPPRYGPSLSQSFAATPAEHPWVIHLAEGTDESARGELAQLDALGCLASNTVIVHGVGMTGADVDLVIERGASVVWCPASNIAMLGRTICAPLVRRLFEAGRLALGTDSRLTGSRDLLDELRVAAAHSDLLPNELLRLVTCGASRVLRLPDRGDMGAGRLADCVIIRDDGDPHGALMGTPRSAIRAVVRGGTPVVADEDFSEWFLHCGVESVFVRLDGRPKLLAHQVLRPGAVALESGLDWP